MSAHPFLAPGSARGKERQQQFVVLDYVYAGTDLADRGRRHKRRRPKRKTARGRCRERLFKGTGVFNGWYVIWKK